MSKKNILIISGLMLLAAAVAILLASLLLRSPVHQTLPSSIQFKTFNGKNPPFNFTFEYPSAWMEKKNQYIGKFDMVGVLGSKDEQTKFVVSAFVTKKPLEPGQTLQTIVDSFLDRRKGAALFKVLLRKEADLPAGRFYKLEYKHTEDLPLYSAERQKVVIKERTLFCVREGFSFQLSFAGTEEQFKTHELIFDHLLKTFAFKD